MDFGAREILIFLGILVLVAVLLDGIRRVNRARHGKLRSSTRRASRHASIFDDDDDDYPSELPSRGARVVQVRDERSAEEVSEKIKRDCDYTRNKFTAPFRARGEQPAPDRDPDIFDPPASDIPADPREADDPPQGTPAPQGGGQAPFTAVDDYQGEAHDGMMAAEPPPLQDRQESPRGREAEKSPSGSPQEDILVLHLMAHKGQFFEGEQLLEQLLDHGLRYGAMRIFHRHETKDGAGPVHFSVANSVNPGVFDLNIMDQFSTPGITFIMPLDGLEKPLESFDTLIATAASMARKLDGELKDETRSALTKQTIEHYRQRIIDFTRRSFTLTN